MSCRRIGNVLLKLPAKRQKILMQVNVLTSKGDRLPPCRDERRVKCETEKLIDLHQKGRMPAA